jgi:hypothetical protein
MLLGLPLTSMLGLYSELRSSSVIHLPPSASQKYSSASLQSHTHIYQPHSELRVYPCYEFSELHSDVCSGVHSDIRVSICLTSLSPRLRTLFGPPSLSTLFLYLQVQARTFGPRLDLRPCPRYNPNPCHPTPLGCPLGHPCLTLSYKFEPVPLGPTRTSVLVHVTSAVWIRTARNSINTLNKMLSMLHYVASWSRHVTSLIKIHSLLPSSSFRCFVDSNVIRIWQHSGVSNIFFLQPTPAYCNTCHHP